MEFRLYRLEVRRRGDRIVAWTFFVVAALYFPWLFGTITVALTVVEFPDWSVTTYVIV